MQASVPTFYLYGEPHRGVDPDFMHAEALEDRSRPSAWTIRLHAHAALHQVIHIQSGGGTMLLPGVAIAFAAPCALLLPANRAHGFTFEPESRGAVITLADAYLEGVARREPAIRALFAAPRSAPLSVDASDALDRQGQRLRRELGWAAPGHRLAAEAASLDLLLALLRDAPTPPPDRRQALVARFRERVEARFRLREPIAAHARALGVSASVLRAACVDHAGQSPSAMLDARTVLEARRALVFSTLSVAEVGYGLGFADPAYFTRFFARHAGVAPTRARARGAGPAERIGSGQADGAVPMDSRPAPK